MKPAFNQIGIVGLGLIGGSLSAQIKAKFPTTKVFAQDSHESALEFAKKKRWIDAGVTTLSKLPKKLDLVIVATPMHAINKTVNALAAHLESPCVITDVGSVKTPFVKAKHKLRAGQVFIGGHPMAGSEKSGVENASVRLFDKASYLLCPVKSKGYLEFKQFLAALDFYVVELDAETHDRLLALASHLPYFMAMLSVQTVKAALKPSERKLFAKIIAGGFRDTTRVASASPLWAKDIAELNKKSVVKALKLSEKKMGDLLKLIEKANSTSIASLLKSGKQFRDSLYA